MKQKRLRDLKIFTKALNQPAVIRMEFITYTIITLYEGIHPGRFIIYYYIHNFIR